MAWFSGKVSLGNFQVPDLAGAVNKLSESVKNIEKNFDSALGLEEKSDSTSTSEASGLWPVMSWHKSEDKDAETEESRSPLKSSEAEDKKNEVSAADLAVVDEGSEVIKRENDDEDGQVTEKKQDMISEQEKVDSEADLQSVSSGPSEAVVGDVKAAEPVDNVQEKEGVEVAPVDSTELVDAEVVTEGIDETENVNLVHNEMSDAVGTQENQGGQNIQADETGNESLPVETEVSSSAEAKVSPNEQSEVSSGEGEEKIDVSGSQSEKAKEVEPARELSLPITHRLIEDSNVVSESVLHESEVRNTTVEENKQVNDHDDIETKQQRLSSVSKSSNSIDSTVQLEKVKKEMIMMENALQGAARQAQAKADEIAKLMNENEQLKITIEDLKRKSSDAEIESLREEYHQRVANLERKVYALTKERDTLRREQNKKSDAAALLKEKDEIINQIMAEGEELSKKQAAQESTIRKLRAQVRELEEEKKGFMTKLQVEENKVESIKKDKAATEKLLQETIEKHQAELATQKEYYTSALAAAKEAEALTEARANNEARTELESRLREAEERESMLVQAIEELRQTLSQKDQQAVSREDALRREIEDLQKRCQESERRCEELISQVPESTRPLLRQIEAMQESASSRAEAWNAVERSLNFRLQEAEAKAAAAEERERSVNERLSQTLSRINVLEAQISCLRAEQTQLNRSLEKERQRAAENRQDYLAVKEEADTQAGRTNQLEEEIKELRRKHKQELQDALIHRELLQQELEREKTARLELEKTSRVYANSASDQPPLSRSTSAFENGTPSRKLSTASSLGSMEESYFLQSSLDPSDNFSDRRNAGEATMSPYYMKSMTPSAFESALRQKEGELASYMSRLASMESIRDSLAEELVQMTAECEKLRAEAALLPGIRAELDALRRRHSAALELMGERDEELEELRADIIDLKEMYREQVNLLVNKIQVLSSSMGNT